MINENIAKSDSQLPASDSLLPLPSVSKEMLDRLRSRRSNLVKLMGGQGPDRETLHDILNISARVPDHRKLEPWRFVVFEGDARAEFGQHIGSAFKKDNPNMPLDRVMFESARLQRAPLVVAVIASPKECPRGTPLWEQELSAGAVCFNMLLAAQAHGFAAQWLTEWYGYHDGVNAALGLSKTERIAGYIYIGHTEEAPAPRARPDIEGLVEYWGE
jgi:nitroreductase